MAELNNDEGRQSRGKRVLGLFKKSLGMAEPVKPAKKIDDAFLRTAAERADEAFNRERDNIEAAYNDLEFLAGNQWPDWARKQREAQDRPCLTENRMPQFKRQVTGDMRLMRPAIKVTVGDSVAKPAIAELIAGMIRRIENRSEAKAAYALAADSQVTAGIGHLRVTTEYAEESTANQEIRIVQVEDGVAVLWDTNAILPTREDAEWCLVPVDYSLSKFKANWPDVNPEDFRSYDKQYAAYWYGDNRVRVAEYWEKQAAQARVHDGRQFGRPHRQDRRRGRGKRRVRVRQDRRRDGHKIFRSLITLGAVLEARGVGRLLYPDRAADGRGDRIGRRIVRHGVIRFAKDPQILYNMGISAQAEIIALAPRRPLSAPTRTLPSTRTSGRRRTPRRSRICGTRPTRGTAASRRSATRRRSARRRFPSLSCAPTAA